MPFFRVRAGYGIDAFSCANIMQNGIPPTIYANTVRVTNFWKTVDETIFEIEADNETIAIEWRDALIHAIGKIEQYNPETPENPDTPPGPLDVWVKVGTWTKTITESPTVISGLPSAPKGVIFWGSGLSGNAFGTYNDAGTVVIGISDGTTHRCLAYACQDNVSTTNCYRSTSARGFHIVDPTATGSGQIKETATISFDSTSFNMNWSGTTLACTGLYFVFGGTDIQECVVKEQKEGTSGTTVPQIVTYSGLGNQFDFAFVLNQFTGSASDPPPWPVTGFANAFHSISVHAGNDNARTWSANIMAANAQASTSNTAARVQRTNRFLHTLGSITNARQQAAEWDGWTSDGYKLKWIDLPATNLFWTGLFVRGGKWDASEYLQPTSNGTVTALVQDSTSEIRGIMGFSVNNIDIPGGEGGTAPSKFAVGAQDSAGNKGCLAYAGNTNTSNTEESTVMVSNKFMKHITTATTASSSTTNAECTISNMTTDGQFTANYTTTDSTARQVLWFSLSA